MCSGNFHTYLSVSTSVEDVSIIINLMKMVCIVHTMVTNETQARELHVVRKSSLYPVFHLLPWYADYLH